jgi:hypothetical protein
LKRQDNQVVDRSEIFACKGRSDVPIGPLAIALGNLWKWGVEPSIGSTGADLSLSDRGKVLIEPSFVGCSYRFLEPPYFG